MSILPAAKQRFATLATTPVTPLCLAALEKLVANGTDRALFRINPVALAAATGLPENDLIDAFLHATQAGLFSMSWSLLCPACGASVKNHASLKSLEAQFHCAICSLDPTVSLDDFIMVSFTVAPTVRGIKYHEPERLSVEDYTFDYHFNATGRFASGRSVADVFGKLVIENRYVLPQTKAAIIKTVQHDRLRFYDVTRELSVDVNRPDMAQTLRLTYTPDRILASAEPGSPAHVRGQPMNIILDNPEGTRRALMLVDMPELDADGDMMFDPFLTGKRLITSQTFRDLFRTETLSAAEGIAIQAITILFTDLKDSTALYQRVGDLNAFALVRSHFDALKESITAHQGSIVKTIGDAVMASFMNPIDALQAAGDMLKRMQVLNRTLKSGQAVLKIGLHHGPAIAVTLNDRLDYFGQTVNIAARIQGLAAADEICVSEAVRCYPGFAPVAEAFALKSEQAQLKGISGDVAVHRLT